MMEHSYPLHGHTRSMSSLASTIIPVRSDASPLTTFATSPVESQDAMDTMDVPIELRIPLPASSTCSGDEEDYQGQGETDHQQPENAPAAHEVQRAHDMSGHSGRELQDGTVSKGLSEATTAGLPAISLDELAQLIRLERYQFRHTLSSQNYLSRLMLSCGLSRRLIRTTAAAYVDMLNQFKVDNQAGFAALLGACEQLFEGCDRTRLCIPADVGFRGEDSSTTHVHGSPISWLQDLPQAQQDDILGFVSKIRTDPNFLPDRISSLSSAELVALSSPYQFASVVDSVLQNQSYGNVRGYDKARRLGPNSSALESLRGFHHKDVLFALFYDVFDDSSSPGSSEYIRRIDVWSATCTRITALGKRGSDEFLNFVLDSFAGLQEWPLRPKLELFLLRILQEGAFLLESSTDQPMDFKQPIEIRKAKAAIAGSNFFDQALKDLFKMLTEVPARDSIPGGVLDFSRSFLDKIKDPRIRQRAKNIIAVKWYFSSFLSNVLVYPESQGLMMSHHIGASARQAILKELVIRVQKHVVDVTSPWRNTQLVAPEIQARISQFFQYFEPRSDGEPTRASVLAQGRSISNTFKVPLMLSPYCLTELVRTLFQDSPPSSSSTNSIHNGLESIESSVAGSSTLTTGSMEHGSGLASSTASSISGTSMTSTTMLSEGPFIDHQIKDEEFSLLRNSEDGSYSKQGAEGTQRDIGLRLRSVCEKLAERQEPQMNSNGANTTDLWAFIYISDNGEDLSLTPFETAVASEKPPDTTEAVNDQWANLKDSNYEFLREVVVRLLDDQARPNDFAYIADATGHVSPLSGLIPPLEGLVQARLKSCQSQFNFHDAHFWWRSLEALQHFQHNEKRSDSYEMLLRLIGRDVKESMTIHAGINERNDKWIRTLDMMRGRQQNTLQRLEADRYALRLKMWYVSDVRHSSTYEDTLHVIRALRAMASPHRLKQPGSITNWARHRLRNSTGHDRSEVQALEVISAQKDHGGPSKLADEQIELTSGWLTRNSIENFCKGEERIHRFCFEVQKCVNKLGGANLLDSPVLWSSQLFQREKAAFDKRGSAGFGDPSAITAANAWSGSGMPSSLSRGPASVPITFHSLRANELTNNINRLWHTPRTVSPESARTEFSGPPRIHDPVSVGPFWLDQSSTISSAVNQPDHLLASHPPRLAPIEEDRKVKKKAFIHQLKQNLSSLLLSDLGYLLWAQGSETDAWVSLDLPKSHPTSAQTSIRPQPTNDIVANDERSPPGPSHESVLCIQTESDFSNPTKRSSIETATDPSDPHSIVKHPSAGIYDRPSASSFPYSEAYKRLLQKFSTSPDPHVKLQMLYELEMLVLDSIQQQSVSEYVKTTTSAQAKTKSSVHPHLTARTMRVPRTKATSLEEVVANCFERRAGTLKSRSPNRIPSTRSVSFYAPEIDIPDTDDIVNTLLAIFHDSNFRPHTLYRDLQIIAAFVPSEILDQTPKGKAFWDAGLAALALKEDLCESMMDRANEITTYHISGKKSFEDGSPIPQHLVNTTLKDAAELWIVIAKEGSPTAARELGLFYLTHPELLPRVTLPLSKSKDVFKSIISSDRSGNESGALDPLTFAVVFHWMELAANGGDRDAKDFLRGNGELSAVM